MILAALLLQASAVQPTAESRRLYEPYRQCLSGQAALLAGPEGESSGLDQARSRCMAQNLSAGTNALFVEMRTGASQSEAGERVAALRIEVEQEALAAVRANHGVAAPADTAANPAPSAPPAMARDVRLVSLDIPDEIAPAIVPYLRCVMASNGVQMRSAASEPQPPAAAVGADCSATRAQSARRGEEMLGAQHRGSLKQRRAFVERALVGVDAFAARSAGPPSLPEEEPDAKN
jgi:hypothetical protein